MTVHETNLVVGRIADLDGYYLHYQVWTQGLDEEDIENGVVCQVCDLDSQRLHARCTHLPSVEALFGSAALHGPRPETA